MRHFLTIESFITLHLTMLHILLPDALHKAPSRAARAEERPFLFVSGVVAGCMLFWHCIFGDNCQDNGQTAFLRKWNEGESQEGRDVGGDAFGRGEAGDTTSSLRSRACIRKECHSRSWSRPLQNSRSAPANRN